MTKKRSKKKEKTSPDRDKGSSRHMLDLVSSPKFESILSDLLEDTDARLADADCRHPKGRSKKKDWSEPQVESYLKKHPLDDLPGVMDRKWWKPFGGKCPTWDLLCHIEVADEPGLLLVEAKAHVGEIGEKNRKEPPKKGNARSIANDYSIRLRLAEASLSLTRLGIGHFSLSADHHYQLSNRIAYLHKLANDGVPTVLMYLGWLNSSDWPDKPLNSHDHWEKTVRDHMKPIAPWQFVGGDGSATMQMIVRSVEAKVLDGE
jgi:hypothetical protein